MSKVESSVYYLSTQSSNQLKIIFDYTEKIENGTNKISWSVNIWTQYRINGTWNFIITVNGKSYDCKYPLSHPYGTSTIKSEELDLSYNGSKTISVYVCIKDMDYYSVSYGTGSTAVKSPTLKADVTLKNLNTAPTKAPEVVLADCNHILTNRTQGGKKVYAVKDCIGAYITDSSLIGIDKEDGKNVNCYINVEQWNGKSYVRKTFNRQYLTTNKNTGDHRYSISGSKRGTLFRVNGYVTDSGNLKGPESDYIYILKNQLPSQVSIKDVVYDKNNNTVKNLYLNDGDDFTISWNPSTDHEISQNEIQYNLYFSNDDGKSYNLIKTYNGTEKLLYSQHITGDPDLSTYKYKICAFDKLEEGSPVYTSTYHKNGRPTAPKNILPDNCERIGKIKIQWDSSIDPDKRGIKKYVVSINDKIIGETKSTYYDWNIPEKDITGTSYTIKIYAVDVDDGQSDVGTANFTKAEKLALENCWILPDKEDYYENLIKLEWEKPKAKCDYFELDVKINNQEWILLTKTKDLTYTHDISNLNRGTTIKYRIRAINDLQISDYIENPNLCHKNNISSAPVIEFPLNNSILYGVNPRIAFYIDDDQDNQKRSICVEYNNKIYNNIENKEMFSILDNTYSNKKYIVFTCPNLNYGKCTLYFYTNDGLINGEKTELNLVIEKLDSTNKYNYIYATYVNTIENKINTIRKNYGLNTYNFSKIISKKTFINPNYINILKEKLYEIRNKINEYDSSNVNTLSTNIINVNKNDYILSNYINNILDIIRQP